MIRLINDDDFKEVYKLGILVNENFSSLFDLNQINKLEYSYIYVYEQDGVIFGFVHFEKMYETVDIINIVVNPLYRHQHVGTDLLKYIIDNFKFEHIMLEVDEKNANAINLYKKFDFKEINRRKKYYGENDAIIMEMRK